MGRGLAILGFDLLGLSLLVIHGLRPPDPVRVRGGWILGFQLPPEPNGTPLEPSSRAQAPKRLDACREVLAARLRELGPADATCSLAPPDQILISLPEEPGEDLAHRGEIVRQLATQPSTTLEFLPYAPDVGGLDMQTEKNKLLSWFQQHPEAEIRAFQSLASDQGGPAPGLRWFPAASWIQADLPPESLVHGFVPLVSGAFLRPAAPPGSASWDFGSRDLEWLSVSRKGNGTIDLEFRIRPERAAAFPRFTSACRGSRVGIVVAGKLQGLSTVENPLLPDGFISFPERDLSDSERIDLGLLDPKLALPVPLLPLAHVAIPPDPLLAWTSGFRGSLGGLALLLLANLALWRLGRRHSDLQALPPS